MKESMWGYLIVGLGISIIFILLLVQNLTSTKQSNFYLGREVMEAALIDAVDYGNLQRTGKVTISKEKFVETVVRRFAESVVADRTYRIDFYDIHEYPPKATFKIVTDTGETVIDDTALSADINTYITSIIEAEETKYEDWVNYCNNHSADSRCPQESDIKEYDKLGLD